MQTEIHEIDGPIKATRNGKVVCEARTSDLDMYARQYVGETVAVRGRTYTVASVGNPFSRDSVTRVYMYLDATAKPTGHAQPCPHCGTYCDGDCRAN